MKLTHLAVLLWLFSLVVGPAGTRADRVWLKNGNFLEGEVRTDAAGEEVEIVSTLGVMRISAKNVARIERSATVEEQADRYLEQLGRINADTLYEVAKWCADQGAETLSRRLLERALGFDPQHGASRQALGYRQFEGRWVSEREWHELRGEVVFRGEWMTPEARAHILSLEILESRAAAERDYWNRRLELEEQRQTAAVEQPTGIPVTAFYPSGVVTGTVLPGAPLPLVVAPVAPGLRIPSTAPDTPDSSGGSAKAPSAGAPSKPPRGREPKPQPPRHHRGRFKLP